MARTTHTRTTEWSRKSRKAEGRALRHTDENLAIAEGIDSLDFLVNRPLTRVAAAKSNRRR